MKERRQPLSIETNPAGAQISVAQHECSSPCSLVLARQQDYNVHIAKDGYLPQTIKIKGDSWDPWIWGNLIFIFFAPIGLFVDFYSGYAYDFKPSKVDIDLKKASPIVK